MGEFVMKLLGIGIIDNLAAQGAQVIILGCTEIGMLIKQVDTDIKLFDTTAIHAQQAVKYAITSSSQQSSSYN